MLKRGDYEGLSSSFAAACRAADAERARHDQAHKFRDKGKPGTLKGRAAASTVEALMYSLRERRTAALKEPQTRQRIAALSEDQLHEVCGRLEKLKLEKPWTADEVVRLVEIWAACHGG